MGLRSNIYFKSIIDTKIKYFDMISIEDYGYDVLLNSSKGEIK